MDVALKAAYELAKSLYRGMCAPHTEYSRKNPVDATPSRIVDLPADSWFQNIFPCEHTST
jgi:hypothetical protein